MTIGLRPARRPAPLLQHALDHGHALLNQVVLPDAHDRPRARPQRLIHTCVPRAISLQLRVPVAGVLSRDVPVLRAAMEKSTRRRTPRHAAGGTRCPAEPGRRRLPRPDQPGTASLGRAVPVGEQVRDECHDACCPSSPLRWLRSLETGSYLSPERALQAERPAGLASISVSLCRKNVGKAVTAPTLSQEPTCAPEPTSACRVGRCPAGGGGAPAPEAWCAPSTPPSPKALPRSTRRGRALGRRRRSLGLAGNQRCDPRPKGRPGDTPWACPWAGRTSSPCRHKGRTAQGLRRLLPAIEAGEIEAATPAERRIVHRWAGGGTEHLFGSARACANRPLRLGC